MISWRYKVIKRFANVNGEIRGEEFYDKIVRVREKKGRIFLYRPSSRRYDYLDYSGVACGQCVAVSELTPVLEFLGYIKFVERKEVNGDTFSEENYCI